MITKIGTADDVNAFAKQIITEGVSFHPDDDFNDYVNFKENTPTYTKEAYLMNDFNDYGF